MLKAVIFDFDGTLTPNIRPSFKILEASGLEGGTENPAFFKDVGKLAQAYECDVFEAMARHICEIAQNAGYTPTRENLSLGANQRVYNPGVHKLLHWLQSQGVANYLVSSGLHDYLQQTTIAQYFQKIYATTFHYDEDGVVTTPDFVMSESNKIVAINEVAHSVNKSSTDFSGIVYIGDGATDVEAMKHIKQHGGKAILVHLPEDSQELQKAQATAIIDMESLVKTAQGMVDLYALADFTDDSEVTQFLHKLQAS